MKSLKENFVVGVLDFDDVLVRGSEGLKHKAWVDIFPVIEHLEIQRRWQSYYANGKGDRFGILRATLKEIYGADADIEKLVLEKAVVFDDSVQQGILRIGVANEDRAALSWLQERFTLFLNSATPQKAIEETIQKLGLSEVFTGVFGQHGSTSKVENLKKAASFSTAQPEQMFFVGDSDGDLNAANSFGCQFIGVATERNGWKKKRPELLLVKSLAEFPMLFEK